MNTNDELYKVGLALHGHQCPAMPLGLRAGLAAMAALGVRLAPNLNMWFAPSPRANAVKAN